MMKIEGKKYLFRETPFTKEQRAYYLSNFRLEIISLFQKT